MLQKLQNQWPYLLFGFLFTLGSSFGQTFFISLFVKPITEAFDFSAADFATYYALLTLVSAALLPSLGKRLDNTDLLHYATGVCCLAALGAVTIALAPHFIVVIIGVFLVRLSGQGLMGHIGVTATSRHFSRNRGKALSIVLLGHPAGEALFPILVVICVQQLGWRMTYGLAGAVSLFAILPLAWILVKSRPAYRSVVATKGAVSSDETERQVDNRPEGNRAISRKFLFILLPSFIAMPMFITALIFHQSLISESMGLPLVFFAKCFVIFAVTQVATVVGVGLLVDRWSARALYPYHLFPLVLAVGSLLVLNGEMAVVIYYALLGVGAGYSSNVKMAYIAEIAPLEQLGKYKSMAVSAMVFSTSLGPPLFAQVIEFGGTYYTTYMVTALFCVGAFFLALMARRYQGV